MEKRALFFGAIGTLTETSELQRHAFNKAFVTAGIDWYWDQKTYVPMLQQSGGKARIARFAESLGETVDAAEIHALKVRHFADLMAQKGLTLRPGVRKTLDAAKAMGWKVAFVTSTGKDQSQAMIDALGEDLSVDDFDYIGSADRVENSKPAPDIYHDALETLGLEEDEVIAIEDSASSAEAARAAGIETYVTPGAPHTSDSFPDGARVVTQLDASLLQQHSLAAE